MSDIGLTFAPVAGAQNSATINLARVWSQLHWFTLLLSRSHVALLNTVTAVFFLGASIFWPGAVLLALIFLMAARAAVTATTEFHGLLAADGGSARSLLRWIGLGALIGAIPTLVLLSGAPAIIPVLLGAWCTARARGAWLFAAGTACLALGLMALTAFGATHAAPIAFVVIQAASTGAIMLALSLPTPHDRPVEAHPAALPLLPCRTYELNA